MAAKNTSNKANSLASAAADSAPAIIPQADSTADAALSNEALPIRFANISDAIAEYEVVKERIRTMEHLLETATSAIAFEDGRIFFGVYAEKRVSRELPWIELRFIDTGELFGRIDPLDIEDAENELTVAMIPVVVDGKKKPFVMADIASRRERQTRERNDFISPISFWQPNGRNEAYTVSFDRAIRKPYEELLELKKLIAQFIEESVNRK